MVKPRRHSLLTAFFLLAAASVTAIPAGAAPVTAGRPALRIVDTMPLMLHGLRFRPLENVKVAASTRAGTTTRVVRADRQGRFAARFPRIVVTRCLEELVVKAVGSRGSRAGFTLTQPQCEPARSTTPATD